MGSSGGSSSGTSRPSSYVQTPSVHTSTFSLGCPSCRKVVYFDEHGAHNLPRYRAMQNIVDKFLDAKTLATLCQLCEPPEEEVSVVRPLFFVSSAKCFTATCVVIVVIRPADPWPSTVSYRPITAGYLPGPNIIL